MGRSSKLLAGAAAVALGVAAGCTPAAKPDAVVSQFYTIYVANRPAGLPYGEDLARLSPFLSRGLNTGIRQALDHKNAFIERHTVVPQGGGAPVLTEKPPFVDGCHFSSLFEGPTAFEIVRAAASADGRWDVTVRFSHRSEATWEDVIVVAREDGRYVVDDVVYGGAGEFNPAGRLSERLAFRETETGPEPAAGAQGAEGTPPGAASEPGAAALTGRGIWLSDHWPNALDFNQQSKSGWARDRPVQSPATATS